MAEPGEMGRGVSKTQKSLKDAENEGRGVEGSRRGCGGVNGDGRGCDLGC